MANSWEGWRANLPLWVLITERTPLISLLHFPLTLFVQSYHDRIFRIRLNWFVKYKLAIHNRTCESESAPRKYSTHDHVHYTFTVNLSSTPEEFDFTHHSLNAPPPLPPHSDDPYSINQPAIFIRCKHQPSSNSSPCGMQDCLLMGIMNEYGLSIYLSLSLSLSLQLPEFLDVVY